MTATTLHPFWHSIKTIITGFVIGMAACMPIVFLFEIGEKGNVRTPPSLLINTVLNLTVLIYGQVVLKSTILNARVSTLHFIKLFSLFVVFFLAMDVLSIFVKLPSFSNSIFVHEFKQNPTHFFISVVVIAPILEELIFRGVILDYLLKHKSEKTSILYSGLIFGLMHFSPDQVFFAFFAGILLGYVYVKSRNIVVPILFHAINNALSFVYIHYGHSSFLDFFKN